jgi:hypothetical protein
VAIAGVIGEPTTVAQDAGDDCSGVYVEHRADKHDGNEAPTRKYRRTEVPARWRY